MTDKMPCSCTVESECTFGKTGRMYAICRGFAAGVSAAETIKYRQLWEAQRLSPVGATPSTGPGTELKSLLSMLGFKAGSCQCHSHVFEMNRRGSKWCSENMDIIIGWLREEARKRSVLFLETPARIAVKLAIWKADSATHKPNPS